MRGLFSSKCLNILSHSFQNFSAGLGKLLASSSVFCQSLRNGNRQLIIKKIWGTPFGTFQDIWLPLTWPLNCKIKCIRIQCWLTKIATRLFDKPQINSAYNSWEEILFGIPQGSVLGPLLFKSFLFDLFLIMNDTGFASYADDNTPYTIRNNMEDVIFKLQNSSKTLLQ